MTESLLPQNKTELDIALEQACIHDLSPDVLRTLHTPDTIPEPLLPWLAWGEDVPVWPSDPAARRDIIQRSHALHGLIGTASGLKAAARLAHAKVTHLVSPPAKTFLGGWTDQARRDWLAAMPQLRVYPRRGRSRNTSVTLGGCFVGDAPHRSDAVYRSTARTVIHHPDGSTDDLTTLEWDTATATGNATLSAARTGVSWGMHVGGFTGYPATGSARHRLYTLNQQAYHYNTATLTIRAVAPSLKPLSTDVEIVSDRAARPGAYLLGLPVGGQLCRLDTETRYYRRIYLHDPTVTGRTTASPAHLGATRLGMPPFHIEARIKVAATVSRSGHVDDCLGGHFPAGRSSAARLDAPLKALQWMRAEADKVLIDTRNSRAVIARQHLLAGDVIAGQIIER
jgi:hypothetical protein